MKGGNTAAKQIKNLYHHVNVLFPPQKAYRKGKGGKGKGERFTLNFNAGFGRVLQHQT